MYIITFISTSQLEPFNIKGLAYIYIYLADSRILFVYSRFPLFFTKFLQYVVVISISSLLR